MKEKALVLKQINWQSLLWFSSLLLVAVIVPCYVHQQFITGPIVNAVLFLAVYTLGAGGTVLIGLMPSVAALVSGLLPLPLAPMVPFIMIANAILVLVFAGLRKTNYIFSAIMASLCKYLFLNISVFWVVKLISQKPIAAKATATMMQWPQLVTALAGALIAFLILKSFKKL